MIKPTYITRPVQRAPSAPDVSSHEDIDWRVVSVAEVRPEDRELRQMRDAIQKAARMAHAQRKRSVWDTFLRVLGVRHGQ